MHKSLTGYMRQLDGLRAIAVAIVLVHHLVGVGSLPFLLKHIPYGYLGVRLFFVLSGFLWFYPDFPETSLRVDNLPLRGETWREDDTVLSTSRKQ